MQMLHHFTPIDQGIKNKKITTKDRYLQSRMTLIQYSDHSKTMVLMLTVKCLSVDLPSITYLAVSQNGPAVQVKQCFLVFILQNNSNVIT